MRLQTTQQKAGWTEIWARTQLGSKLSANVSPAGTAVSIGITNTLAMTGVSNTIGADEARKLAMALLQFADSADAAELLAALVQSNSVLLTAYHDVQDQTGKRVIARRMEINQAAIAKATGEQA